MNLSFSKTYLSEYYDDSNARFTNLKLYHVYESGNLIGQYFRQSNKHYFNFLGTEITIIIKKELFKKTEYLLIDKKNLQTIGSFDIPNVFNQNTNHYPDIPYSAPYLKIQIGNKIFKFRRELSSIDYSVFDKETWGYYRFALYNDQMKRKVVYDFKIEDPLLDTSISPYHDLTGSIKVLETNYQLMFAGFFLLEQFFDVNQNFG